MERALRIVVMDPNTDVADHAKTLVDLGDTYTITTDSRNKPRYLEAWNLLQQHPELAGLKDELFGTPHRLYPQSAVIYKVERTPTDLGKDEIQRYLDIEFSVIEDGRVSDVKIVDGNLSASEMNMMRQQMRSAKYRPRIVDGELIETPGLMLHQNFEYVGPLRSKPGISISVNQ